MIKYIYAIRDKKVGDYGKPFVDDSDIQATRGLCVAMKDPSIQLSHFPDDYDLYKLGQIDNVSGKVEGCEPVFIIGAVSCIPKNQVQIEQMKMVEDEIKKMERRLPK